MLAVCNTTFQSFDNHLILASLDLKNVETPFRGLCMKTKSLFLVLFIIALPSCLPAEEQSKTTDIASMTGRVVYFSELVNKNGSAEQALSAALSHDKVIIDFSADWCGPCRNLGPIIEDLAKEFPGVLFVKLDVDQFRSISRKYGIRGIPALLYFKNGTKVAQEAGLKSKSELRTTIHTKLQ